MIKREALKEAIYEAIKKSACHIPPDVYAAFERWIKAETQALSKRALEDTLESLKCSIERKNPACGDTGWPLFSTRLATRQRLKVAF